MAGGESSRPELLAASAPLKRSQGKRPLHRGLVRVKRVEGTSAGGESTQHLRNLTAWIGLRIPATSAMMASFAERVRKPSPESLTLASGAAFPSMPATARR